MGLTSLVHEIASDLNDIDEGFEFSNWSRGQITTWLLEGANMVYDRRPDLFITRVIIKVKPYSILQDTCNCTTLRRVIGQVTESGRLVQALRVRDMEMTFKWNAPSCKKPMRRAGDTFMLDNYKIDTVSNSLYVWPEISANVNAWVEVECTHRPTEEEILSGSVGIPTGAMVAVKQWALWRARSVDMEVSPAMYQAAQMHYKAFFDVLGLTTSNTDAVIHQKEIK